jgi:hypothetical protein
MGNEEQIKSWIGIIPEFYYDIISRIPPGSFLVLGVVYELFARNGDKLSNYTNLSGGVSVLLTILLIIASYTVGLFLNVPTKYLSMMYTSGIWRRIIKQEQSLFLSLKKKKEFKSFDLSPSSKINDEDARRLYRTIHDVLKLKNPQAKLFLPKLMAESALCNNFSFALFIFLILHAINCEWQKAISEWYVYLIGALFCIILVWMASARLYRALETHIVFLRDIG